MARGFDGTSGRITVADISGYKVGLSGVSWSAWAAASGAGTNNPRILNVAGNPAADDGSGILNRGMYLGRLTTGGDFFYGVGNGTDAGFRDSSVVMNSGIWWHVAVTYDGTTASIYISGNKADSFSYSGAILYDTMGLYIGHSVTANESGSYWNGLIAEVAIWSGALTADEVKTLAVGTAPYDVRSTALAAYWPLWGLDSPEPDIGPNGMNGTLSASSTPTRADTVKAITDWGFRDSSAKMNVARKT